VRFCRAYGPLLQPLPRVPGRPGATISWELAALCGGWIVAGSVLCRTPFAEAHDLLPAVLGRNVDLIIVGARYSRFGMLAEIATRTAIASAANVSVYLCIRSPLWAAWIGALGFAIRRALA
jgi:hypothetical protein